MILEKINKNLIVIFYSLLSFALIDKLLLDGGAKEAFFDDC